jgi:hypothetical protein
VSPPRSGRLGLGLGGRGGDESVRRRGRPATPARRALDAVRVAIAPRCAAAAALTCSAAAAAAFASATAATAARITASPPATLASTPAMRFAVRPAAAAPPTVQPTANHIGGRRAPVF